MYFNYLAAFLIILYERVVLLVSMAFCEEFLDRIVVKEILLCHFKHFKCFFSCHKATSNSESFSGDHLSAIVT